MDQFFGKDGKTVILPIDHGTAIPVPALSDPIGLIEETSPFVDGYVVNMGVALAAFDALENKATCLRTDVYKPVHGDNEDEGAFQVFGAEHAELIGANAVMNMLYPNHPNETEIFRQCGELIGDSLDLDVPVILESLPVGIGKPEEYTVENIGFAVRAAAEMGADVVKTAFPTGASVDDFKPIVESCFVPLVVLGGAAMGDDEALLKMVKDAMDAGASGIAVGRNVWQHEQPTKMAQALSAIVHGEDAVKTALKLLS